MQYLFLFFICLAGGIIQSASGFGFAMIAIPLLTLIMQVKHSIVIVAIAGLILGVNILFKMKFKVKWNLVIPIIISMLIGQLAGTQLLFSLETKILKGVFGIVLIVILFISNIFKSRFKITVSIKTTICFGLISGLLGGMFGTAGPPLVIYYLVALEDKEEYLSSLQMTFLIGSSSTLLIHALYGNINVEILEYSALAIVAILIGSNIGLYIFKRIKKETLQKSVYTLIFLMGFLMIVEAF